MSQLTEPIVGHTAGPWRVESRPHPDPAWIVSEAAFDRDGLAIIVAMISVSMNSLGRPTIGKTEQRRNARLIAAAPDLLAVVKMVEFGALTTEIREQAGQAIRKAEGR